jgi:acyl dehydratase
MQLPREPVAPRPAGRCLEDVTIGEALPEIGFRVSLTALVMYAGATWDFHRLHYDQAFAARHGMPAPVMDGQMIGALIARQLMQWGGTDAFVRRLSYRLRTPVHADDDIRLTGSVTGVEPGGRNGLVLCSIDVHKADGTAVVQAARAAVDLPRRPA